MKIGIATDHHGIKVKQEIIHYLESLHYQVIDYGTNSEDMVDYPIYAFQIGEEVVNKNITYGILLCGTGIGMSIACNKVKGIRCAKVSTKEEAKLSREHNNANVIALSSSLDISIIKEIISTFLNTHFSDEERHYRRVEQINHYGENK